MLAFAISKAIPAKFLSLVAWLAATIPGLAQDKSAPPAPDPRPAAGRPAGQAPGGQPEPNLEERNRLWDKAIELQKRGRFDEAVAIAQALLSLERRRPGPDHEQVEVVLEFLARTHRQLGDLTAELADRKQIFECRRRRLGEGHWQTVDARWAVATAERTAALPEGRRTELAEARRLAERVAELHGAGRYADALLLARRVVTTFGELLGEAHPDYASVLNNLAAVYEAKGNYASARPLYERVRDILKAALGDTHPDYAAALNNLASLYRDQGDYATARPLLERARDILKAALGDTHPIYATALNNLAMLYQDQGDYASARPLFERARDILKAAVGEDHPDYAAALNNLASLYRDQGDYATARPLLERARDILKAALGDTHPIYAIALNNLAMLYQDQGDYASARTLFERVRDILKRPWARTHPDYAAALNNLASLCLARGAPSEAAGPLADALRITRANLDRYAPALSSRQQLALMKHYRGSLDSYLSALEPGPGSDPAPYAAVAAWKGSLLAGQRRLARLRRAAATGGEAAEALRQWESLTARLARLCRSRPPRRPTATPGAASSPRPVASSRRPRSGSTGWDWAGPKSPRRPERAEAGGPLARRRGLGRRPPVHPLHAPRRRPRAVADGAVPGGLRAPWRPISLGGACRARSSWPGTGSGQGLARYAEPTPSDPAGAGREGPGGGPAAAVAGPTRALPGGGGHAAGLARRAALLAAAGGTAGSRPGEIPGRGASCRGGASAVPCWRRGGRGRVR